MTDTAGDTESSETDDRPSDVDWEPGDADDHDAAAWNTDRLVNTALAADRYGFSNRGTAAVINGFQMDIGRISEENTALIVEPMKLWRDISTKGRVPCIRFW
ncbi:MAG: hypothetical protein AAF438_21555 [Pseudomonadota bacterium]